MKIFKSIILLLLFIFFILYINTCVNLYVFYHCEKCVKVMSKLIKIKNANEMLMF